MLKYFYRFLLALGALLALAGCAQNPVTGRQDFVMMSEAEELRLGRQSDAEVRKEYGVYAYPGLAEYVDRVGQRLASHSHRGNLRYHFTVVDSPDINAFALPGGYIYITRGILVYLNSEAELAAVLGHAIGHVTARHSVQQYSAGMAATIGMSLGAILLPELRGQNVQNLLGNFGQALLSGYGREHELQADKLGAEYLARSGYDPQAMIRVLTILKNQEEFDQEAARQEGRKPRAYHGIFATHPDSDTRLREVVGEAGRYQASGGEEGQKAYLGHINGIVYGDSPAQGVIRGSMFYHGELGFAVRFGESWHLQNSADKLAAVAPSGDAGMELSAQARPDAPPVDFLRSLLRSVRFDGGSEIQLNPVAALPSALLIGMQQGRPLLVAVVYLNDKAYILAGSARSPGAFSRHEAEMRAAVAGFHALSGAERKRANALHLRTRVAAQGVSLAGLAQKSPLGANALGYLRLLNGLYPSGNPQPGQILKTVEED